MAETLINLGKYWGPERDQVSQRPDILFQDDHLNWLDDCQVILDAGCGTGHLVRKLQAAGKDAVGITYSPKEVSLAHEKYGTDLRLGDLHDLPWPDGVFDAVVCWDALEHTVAPYHVLCEFRRVLKPGGRLLLFMPGDNWVHEAYHILCLTIQQMIHLFQIAGYREVAVHDYGEHPQHGKTNMAVYRATT